MTESNSKETEILEAARNRFAHYGFSKVTMDEIAADIGMGKASLYYYFPTKEELFKSVIKKEQNLFVKEIETLICQKMSSSKKLKAYINKRFEFFHELANLSTLNVQTIVEIKMMFKELFQDFEEEEINLLQRIFDEGRKCGEFNNHLKHETTKVFLHILQGLRLRIIKFIKDNRMEKENYDELKEEMLIFVDIFLKGIKS